MSSRRCPICLENEDNHIGRSMWGQCYQCSQLFCGDCIASLGREFRCPVCRAPWPVTHQAKAKGLRKMLKDRGPGRHAAFAQYSLGWMYRDGEGVVQSDEEGCKWFQLSADQGFALAQYNLGWMYRDGTGVCQNYEAAAKWLQLAADQGDPAAQTCFGHMHYNGNGVIRSFETAIKWTRLAADQGHAQSQYNLGWMYSIRWTMKASEGGEGLTMPVAYGSWAIRTPSLLQFWRPKVQGTSSGSAVS